MTVVSENTPLTVKIGLRSPETDAAIHRIVNAQGEPVSALTWPKYLAWRKTKCRPYDYEKGPKLAVVTTQPEIDALGVTDNVFRLRAIEEIDQATLEFLGEVAEFSELFQEHDIGCFFGELRAKLIDEAGDCFFCGAWALDAWGVNPLAAMADDLELIRVDDDNNLAQFGRILATNTLAVVVADARFAGVLKLSVMQLLVGASTSAGLLANAFKKLKFQRREQSVEKQALRVCMALFAVNQLLVIANSSVEEALQSNQRKLDARFPGGYVQGQGGGIRTGEGK